MEQQLPNRFVEIGRVGKARGLDGTIRFVPGQQFTDEGALSESGILYIRNERSDLVPMRIEKVNREFRRNQPSFFVKFDLIASRDRKSTRLNSSHVAISYAVFCLKEKNNNTMIQKQR